MQEVIIRFIDFLDKDPQKAIIFLSLSINAVLVTALIKMNNKYIKMIMQNVTLSNDFKALAENINTTINKFKVKKGELKNVEPTDKDVGKTS